MSFYNCLSTWFCKRKALPYWCILLMDCLLIYLASVFIYYLYHDADNTIYVIFPLSYTVLFYMLFDILGFKIFHTYTGILRYSSFRDLLRLSYAMISGFAIIVLGRSFLNFDAFFLPLRIRELFAITVFSTLLMWLERVLIKQLYEISLEDSYAKKVFIFGVKEGGIGLAKNVRNEKPTRFVVEGFISYFADITNKTLMCKKIYPIDDRLPKLMGKKGVSVLLISPLKNDDYRNDLKLQGLMAEAGVHVYMTSMAKEWDGKSDLNFGEMKEVDIEDLLPRSEIMVDLKVMREQLTGRKILITGSAGSIGSEMVRQIALFKPKKMMLIDQAETPQHDLQLRMAESFPDIETETVVASVCSAIHMEQIFDQFRPDYVFHAAAYKHVPMMENNPGESVHNNVYGTKIVADLSVKYGVKRFVMISTDKAVNPTNVMGCSKRICEIYVQSLDKAIKLGKVKGITQFVTTRFGNVLGSNGSVIPLFREQIKKGGPVTVTDPNIIRYFMLIPEACKLVLEAGTMGNGGDIFVFDMGKPVKIAELAKRMIQLSDAKDIKIVYTGLREGEKLYEEVLNDKEKSIPTFHPKIMIARVREYSYADVCDELDRLLDICKTYDDMNIVRMMKSIVPEYKSNNSKYSVLD